MWFRSNPTPPVNCCLLTVSGDKIPVDLIYIGRRGGVHYWANPVPIRRDDIVGTSCDLLPARTAITFAIEVYRSSE